MQSLIYCLIFDNSASECTVGITVLTKLLPIFAVRACEDLKRLLPSLLVVLSRIVCWETRPYYTLPDMALEATRGRDSNSLVEPVVEDQRDMPSSDGSNRLPIRQELDWERLDQTFVGASSTAPPRQQYFAFLYYLFPCNTIRFLRGAVSYLLESGLESPYSVEWEEALDEDKIRSKSEVRLDSKQYSYTCGAEHYTRSRFYVGMSSTPYSFGAMRRRSWRSRTSGSNTTYPRSLRSVLCSMCALRLWGYASSCSRIRHCYRLDEETLPSNTTSNQTPLSRDPRQSHKSSLLPRNLTHPRFSRHYSAHIRHTPLACRFRCKR